MSRKFRVTSKFDDLSFEAVLETQELVEIPVERSFYDAVGTDVPDREFITRVVDCLVTKVGPTEDADDVMLVDLQNVQVGERVTIAQFGDKLELHCIYGAYDVSVRYALEEVAQ